MSKDNTSGSRLISEVKQCLLLAVPLAAAQLAQSATGFVDTVMMGWLGSQTIASGGLGAAVYTFCLMITTGIIAAVSPLAAEAYGAGKPEQVGQIVRQGLRISLLLGIPITVLLWHGSTLLVLLGQDVNAASLAQTYLRAIAWGFIPALGFAVFKSFLSALSQPQLVMVTVVLGTLLNITANYVLMFGKFGLPALGLVQQGGNKQTIKEPKLCPYKSTEKV
ncbi:MATE family efflux transporter [Nostoc sp. FACHB-190]|uniref:MATE family efflux transporter n=1 Tax=Nostoc sp. FACHB-190 TaxID=2692838 RepID=UPI001F54F42C|nr:MATE family efflux transporter [Nostoc sp. FACHB-190]